MADLPLAYERVYSIISPCAHVIHVFTHFLARESRIFHSIGDLTSNVRVIGHFNDNLELAFATIAKVRFPEREPCLQDETDRQTDRRTDRQTDRKTDRRTDLRTDRLTSRQTN